MFYISMAEGVGFEPTVGLPLLLISSQVPLTTQPPFHSMSAIIFKAGKTLPRPKIQQPTTHNLEFTDVPGLYKCKGVWRCWKIAPSAAADVEDRAGRCPENDFCLPVRRAWASLASLCASSWSKMTRRLLPSW